MKTSSAKAKGRRLAQEVKDLICGYAPDLKPGDVEITPSGSNGEDIKLSPAARQKFPLVIECKNQEKLNIWDALEQAKSHLEGKFGDEFIVPVLFFRKNNTKPYVAMDADLFFKLIG